GQPKSSAFGGRDYCVEWKRLVSKRKQRTEDRGQRTEDRGQRTTKNLKEERIPDSVLCPLSTVFCSLLTAMRFPQLIIYETDGRLARMLEATAGTHPSALRGPPRAE